MITRKQFGGKLLAAVAAGSLANFALVAEAKDLSSLERGINDKCNGHGKADQCHGRGAKADGCSAKDKAPKPPSCRKPAPDAEKPCSADTCSASDKPTGNE